MTEHDELAERTPSGRFVRNLALSIGGGALATLLGANAAHAQDTDSGTAAAESTGTGTVTTGDATATGNKSNTNTTQTITVSGNLGVIQVINQQANVSNVGAAVANTGGNIAIGNSSENTATTDQTADGGTGAGANNNGAANNVSDGTASITTGAASAVGNTSETNIVQQAHGSAHGQLGGILVINQDAEVMNAGVALANTGANFAFGNESVNDAGVLQNANAEGGALATNNGTASNNSNGKATITTGAGSATGNESVTNVTQKATGDAGGQLGGLMIINQEVDVTNAGFGVANTGANFGWGNSSDNDANVGLDDEVPAPQSATASGTLLDEIGIASNNGEASNGSGGSATITTGAAAAIGNKSVTNVTQTADGNIEGPFGGAIVNQDSNVFNGGIGISNSGFNFGFGNESDNDALTLQEAVGSGFTDVGVVGNFGMAANDSDGTATINSGVAEAAGNASDTNVTQTAEVEGGNFALQNQTNDIENFGLGFANTGGNLGIGNRSAGDAGVDQFGEVTPGDPEAIDVGVIGQFGLASNTSDGTATINSGAANAVGNHSVTNVTQFADPTATTIQIQEANVLNAGFGFANTGGNHAVGNQSQSGAIAGDGDLDAAFDLPGGIPTGFGGVDLDQVLADLSPVLGQINDSLPFDLEEVGDDLLGGGADLLEDLLPDAVSDGLGSSLGQAGDALERLYGALGNPLGAIGDALGGAEIPGLDVVGGILGDHLGDPGELDDPEDLGPLTSLPLDLLGEFTTGVRDSLRDEVSALDDDGTVAPAATDTSDLEQDASFLAGGLEVGTLTLSNDGEASNTSDGTATIGSGNANSNGNVSTTNIGQTTNAGGDGLGIAVSVQGAEVDNVGVGLANTGANYAAGNDSSSRSSAGQTIAGDPEDLTVPAITGDLEAGIVTIHNGGSATNSSDGTATVTTGAAVGIGNNSSTELAQDTVSDIDGLGAIVAIQDATVNNVGVGAANTGDNEAVGNISDADAFLIQDVGFGVDGDAEVGALTLANSGAASNASDGSATITTGAATGTGNKSNTDLDQDADGSVVGGGVIITPQTATVDNLGIGLANTGDNNAAGNASNTGVVDGGAGVSQGAFADIGNGFFTDLRADRAFTMTNQGEAANNSDGTATVTTGAATGEGNTSATAVSQSDPATIEDDGLGLILQDQTATVTNSGFGFGNTGVNTAVGNGSSNVTGSFDNVVGLSADDVDVATGTIAGSATATSASDGTATITTGAAAGRGNVSETTVGQDADSSVGADGLGSLIGLQDATVTNQGAGVANSGVNGAAGNASQNTAGASAGAGLLADDVAADTLTIAPSAAAANQSDGTATISTGVTEGIGNSSVTDLSQALDGADTGMGLALQLQEAEVTNQGAGVANSGINGAVGNGSESFADVDQFTDLPIDDLTAGTVTFAGTASATNASNGTAGITTGAATGRGNVSETGLTQTSGADIVDPGFGLVVDVQEASVTNQGVGAGNSGINGAVGNWAGNLPGDSNGAELRQYTNDGVLPSDDITAGVFSLVSSGTVTNESNGKATIDTGAAEGVGNASETTLTQNIDGTIDDAGLAIGIQAAGVVNQGIGAGNSGINGAVGNASANVADAEQIAEFVADNPIEITGPTTVANNGFAANESDGTATVKTGAASGTGNNSVTDLGQDLDLDPGDGFAVVTMTGGVLNQGIGAGNSGINAALGNISGNDAESDQIATLEPTVDGVLPTQTVTNGGGAENRSTGAGNVATGKATGAGNVSDTVTDQAAEADGPGAIATIAAGTTNEGVGAANSGLNLGLGNASRNTAELDQDANGEGLVTNSGAAGNGTTEPGVQVPGPGGPVDPGPTDPGPTDPGPTDPGPKDTDDPKAPGKDPDGKPRLPITGSEVAAEAVIGGLLMLAGFGFRRAGKRLS